MLEHLNLNVPSEGLAVEFYESLGAVRKPSELDHRLIFMNLGICQLHLLFKDNPVDLRPMREAQVWRGAITIWTTEDLEEAGKRLGGTLLNNGQLLVSCPWGNQFFLERAPLDFSPIGAHRPRSSPAVAIAKVEHGVLPGLLPSILAFYRDVLRMDVYMDGNRCVVPFGLDGDYGNRLEFFEKAGLDTVAYDAETDIYGYHVCIYLEVEAFGEAFAEAERAGCVYSNPRFVHDKGGNGLTWAEAEASGQFRVKDMKDPSTGVVALVLEHEIRSRAHPQCRLPADGTVSLSCGTATAGCGTATAGVVGSEA